jgi:hypothetical protein
MAGMTRTHADRVPVELGSVTKQTKAFFIDCFWDMYMWMIDLKKWNGGGEGGE